MAILNTPLTDTGFTKASLIHRMIIYNLVRVTHLLNVMSNNATIGIANRMLDTVIQNNIGPSGDTINLH